jgi:putative ABC transport system permease protein
MHDVRLAFRRLKRSPGFAGTVVLTLALGVGGCVAIFSAVDGVLLRPLPYPEPDRLVSIRETLLPRFPEFAVAPKHYLDWRHQANSFQDLAAWHPDSQNLTGLGEPRRVSAARVTASIFSTLRVQPALGRAFTAAEDRAGQARSVILGHGFWRRQLGGRPDVLGQTLQLDGEPRTIVGVMPPGFQLDRPLDLYTVTTYPPSGVHDIAAIGRLKAGVSLAQAQSEMDLIARRIDDTFEGGDRWGVKLLPMLEPQVRAVRPVLVTLTAAVAFLLLMACANAANLLLARTTARGRELAVRAALGAGRGRLIRELLVESVLLALAAGLLGTLLAKAGLRALLALAPDALPRSVAVGLDWRGVGFTFALALVTGIGFGLAPAFWATHGQSQGMLERGAGRSVTESRPHQRLRATLVVIQVALALVLLAGGGLLIRSFVALARVSPGFEPRGALAVTLSLPPNRYPTGAEQSEFASRTVRQLAAVPGVQVVGAAQGLPFESLVNHVFFLHVAGRTADVERTTVSGFAVTGNFFEAMGIPLLRGRRFDARDGASSQRVTIINRSLARLHFGQVDPIGQRIGAKAGEWFEIVGVVEDVKFDRLDTKAVLQAYAPLPQAPADWGALTFVVRAGGGPGIAAGIRAAVQTVDRGQAVTSLRPISDAIAASLARQRFALALFVAFAATALSLAALGIYGMLAYSVARRTAELGIRIALGARPGHVLILVLGRAAWMVGLGLLIGLLAAVLLTRFLSSFLFAVTAADPLTFAAITLLFCLVATLACLLPARRAARVSPLTAMRAE